VGFFCFGFLFIAFVFNKSLHLGRELAFDRYFLWLGDAARRVDSGGAASIMRLNGLTCMRCRGPAAPAAMRSPAAHPAVLIMLMRVPGARSQGRDPSVGRNAALGWSDMNTAVGGRSPWGGALMLATAPSASGRARPGADIFALVVAALAAAPRRSCVARPALLLAIRQTGKNSDLSSSCCSGGRADRACRGFAFASVFATIGYLLTTDPGEPPLDGRRRANGRGHELAHFLLAGRSS